MVRKPLIAIFSTAHLLDDDMLEFLKDCKEGLFQFEIGVQTTNQEALDAVGRRDDFEKLSYVVKTIESYQNIHQHLDLIAGLPYEGYDSFEKFTRRLAIPPLFMMFPARINRGMARREKLSTPLFIFCMVIKVI